MIWPGCDCHAWALGGRVAWTQSHAMYLWMLLFNMDSKLYLIIMLVYKICACARLKGQVLGTVCYMP